MARIVPAAPAPHCYTYKLAFSFFGRLNMLAEARWRWVLGKPSKAG
jgi:hypothetical protein